MLSLVFVAYFLEKSRKLLYVLLRLISYRLVMPIFFSVYEFSSSILFPDSLMLMPLIPSLLIRYDSMRYDYHSLKMLVTRVKIVGLRF